MTPMERALALAREALGRASPNPAVGAVVVKDGRVVGEGYYRGPGTPHAEVIALRQAGDQARGAALFVTLEPCCHHGQTPPCTDAVIRSGVREVHFPILDPDPRVNGGGRARLESAGVAVFVGEGEEEARRLNEAYLKHRTTGLPFVTAKFAASLDGKIAATSGDSRWVSSGESREWAHHQRALADAIMVGVNTVLVDNPRLTARPASEEGARHPLRVVVDSHGRTPPEAAVLQGPAKTLIATTDASDEVWRQKLREAGAEVLVLPSAGGRVALDELLRRLGERGILSLLVEGGGTLLGSFFDLGLVDKVQAVIAPMIVGGAAAPTIMGA